MLRCTILAGIVAGLVCAATAQARAAAEFCPATLVSSPVALDASTIRFRLGAISPRLVAGTVKIQTKTGWYAANFDYLPLKPLVQAYHDQGMTFSHEDYLTDDIVVKIPDATGVQYAYVSQAEAEHDSFLNWDRFGSVTCSPTPFSPRDKHNPARPMPPLSAHPIQLAAVPIAPQATASCADPFEDVTLVRAGPFTYPAIYGHDDPTARPVGTTVVVVAVNRDGSIVDSWLWESSGTPLLDQSVLAEARKSTFKPGKAFCENVPGYFVLRSIFTQ